MEPLLRGLAFAVLDKSETEFLLPVLDDGEAGRRRTELFFPLGDFSIPFERCLPFFRGDRGPSSLLCCDVVCLRLSETLG